MNQTTENRHHGTLRSYSAGFIVSVLCTLTAYGAVVGHVGSALVILGAVSMLAIIQLATQIVLFLHVGRRADVWNVVAFIFALIVVGIIVVGSLWIMFNLNRRMMPTPEQMLEYMSGQETGL